MKLTTEAAAIGGDGDLQDGHKHANGIRGGGFDFWCGNKPLAGSKKVLIDPPT